MSNAPSEKVQMGIFEGRAVIVTGSSCGIGRATSQLFAREGAMVTICGRNETSLQETKRLILLENRNSEDKVVMVVGDICEESVMKKIIDETLKKFGRLDVLINNAGGTLAAPQTGNELDTGLDRFDYAISLNTKCVLRMCQLALPHLEKSHGDIVNVGSVEGLTNGVSMLTPYYSVAKAAQHQLTRNLAVYYISKDVRVNSVCPGETSTNILQRHTNEKVKDMVEKLTAKSELIPIQRVAQPEDIAQSIMFLADRKRSMYIVGHVLVIDGGASLQMPLVAESSKIIASIIAGVPIQ